MLYPTRPPTCEPGYTYVPETHYREVVHKVCKPCPEVVKKKKWCYSCKTEEFCVTRNPCARGDGHCGPGVKCAKPMTRNLLIKREVETECPETKCKIECVVERVPYTVWRKVPCPPGGLAPAPKRMARPVPEPKK
ncbi:MAG: hypothetical protein L0Z62_38750 [Gemmataceae bacterium]|nr:hypothetical protein [Gemmataceae bacterium]